MPETAEEAAPDAVAKLEKRIAQYVEVRFKTGSTAAGGTADREGRQGAERESKDIAPYTH